MKIISIGELMVEMANTHGDTYKKTYAGDTFNVAYYMKAYAPAHWYMTYGTVLGTTADDTGAIDFIKKYGIATDGVHIHDTRTIGLFTLGNDAHGEKQYGYWRSLSAAKTYFNNQQTFDGYDLIYFSGITAAIMENRDNLVDCIIESYQTDTINIVYDFNHRRQLWSPDEARIFAEKIINYCHVLKISDEELPWIFGNAMTIEKLSTMTPNAEIIYTKGGDGSERWQNGECTHVCPAMPVQTIVDTSAAGDAFIAYYLVGRWTGLDVMQSLQNASQLASAVLGYKGSIAPLEALPKF